MFKQESYRQTLILLTALVFISILGGGVYYMRVNNPTETTPNSSNTTQELNNFPIYPGASFIEKKKQDPCPEDHSGYSSCDMTTYLFGSKDDFDQITNWYANDPNKTGWSCSGGGGSYDSSRSASGVKSCQNGDLVYALYLSSTQEKTEIQIGVPAKK